MSRIPQTFIDDLLTRVDIVSIIDSRVKLKKAGKNYSACCPFHQEKTPSFTVSPDKQFYYCFGCGASGNALGFVIDYERQGFIDAVESLAKTAGVEVPREQNPQFKQQDFRRKELYEILEEASTHYQQQLKQHPQKHIVINYLKGRGLSGQIARDFGIGFAPAGRNNLLTKLGNNEQDTSLLIDSGLVISKPEENKKYDRFRQRVMFPIRDERGRVIGFGGRVLGDDKPKYLNSPETEVFHKGRELYGLYEARKAERKLDHLLVVEGYMDVIALAQFGIRNAVATLGTACGEEHLKLSFRYVSDVVFCFDGDNAGRSAAKRALTNSLSAMEDGRQIKFLFLPEGQDPDSLVRQIGADRFKAQIKQAVPLEEFLFDVAAEGIDISTMDGRARFSKISAPLIGQLPEGIFRELMFDNLAKRTGLTRQVLNELQQEKVNIVEPTPAPEAKVPTENRPHPMVAEPAPTAVPAHYDLPLHSLKPKAFSPSVDKNPAKIATILLLENPSLLEKLEDIPDLTQDANPDSARLGEIINYLRKRPDSNFNSILGFWGGAKGIKHQQELALLMANHEISEAKSIHNLYDQYKELQDSIDALNVAKSKISKEIELKLLKAKGLKNLTTEEKQRLIVLTKT